MAINYKKQLYANNASTTLSTFIGSTDTAISVTDGSRFPSIPSGSGSFFLVTIDNGVNVEIVEVHGRSGNVLSPCIRGRELTTAQGFLAGTRVENRVTANTLKALTSVDDRLTPVPLLTDLVAPDTVNNNSYLISQVDDSGAPILAVAGLGKWRFINYPSVVLSQLAGPSEGTSSIGYTGVSLVEQFRQNCAIVQFVTGQNRGMCRGVAAVTSTRISWDAAFPNAPAEGDRFEVYQSASSLYSLLGNVLRLPVLIDLGSDYSTSNSLYQYGDGSTYTG